MVVTRIRVHRLEPIVRDLARAQREMGPRLRLVASEFASDVAGRARDRARARGSVHAHVAEGITAIRRGITLQVGRHPAILGAEFGGGGRPRTRQFPPFNPDGYMLYPSLYDPREPLSEVIDRLWDQLDL